MKFFKNTQACLSIKYLAYKNMIQLKMKLFYPLFVDCQGNPFLCLFHSLSPFSSSVSFLSQKEKFLEPLAREPTINDPNFCFPIQLFSSSPHLERKSFLFVLLSSRNVKCGKTLEFLFLGRRRSEQFIEMLETR